jgi:Uma2 family endonuclease
MGCHESYLAMRIARILQTSLETYDLGFVSGEAGTLKILPHRVRVPDICFNSWARFPGRELPVEPIPDLVPDLAIEVLSLSDTAEEMQRKMHDDFTAGVRLAWYIDPQTRSAKSYTTEDQFVALDESGTLFGGDVLPGFGLPLKELFAKVGSPVQ